MIEENMNSDSNLTMLATKSFNQIIEQIQTSSLNFQIQISPFSAIISLKKSLIKDHSGNPLVPTNLCHSGGRHEDILDKKNLELEKKLNTLKHDHALLAKDYAEAKETIKKLEDFHQDVKVKVEAASSEQNSDRLKDELDQATKALKERDDEILQLHIANNTSKAVSVKLNTVLEQNKNKYEQAGAELCQAQDS